MRACAVDREGGSLVRLPPPRAGRTCWPRTAGRCTPTTRRERSDAEQRVESVFCGAVIAMDSSDVFDRER
jgi:hypothetical protein